MGKAANEHYELIRNANILAIPEKARGITNKFVMPLAFLVLPLLQAQPALVNDS
jgi:hypothetical protein